MKELDFSGGFLSVIRNLVGMLFKNTPLKSFTTKRNKKHQNQKNDKIFKKMTKKKKRFML
ncbi:hypothetical protein HpBGD95_06780 [Helicobacter pylori]